MQQNNHEFEDRNPNNKYKLQNDTLNSLQNESNSFIINTNLDTEQQSFASKSSNVADIKFDDKVILNQGSKMTEPTIDENSYFFNNDNKSKYNGGNAFLATSQYTYEKESDDLSADGLLYQDPY